jgi:ElaB/YqjD/DUF883 family membrane-anchored ribosome-binding protein
MSESLVAELSSISATADSLRQRVAELALGDVSRANVELQNVLHKAEQAFANAERFLTRAERLTR